MSASDDRLIVEEGETYTVPEDDYQEWSGATVDGQLDVDGTLALVDNPETPGEEPFSVDDGGFSLPLEIDGLRMVTTGFGFVLTGLIATLLGASTVFKNYAAGILLMFAIVSLVLAGTVGIGLEFFWALIVLTVLVLALGLVMRWSTA
jgi:hypothetical protein